MEQYENLVKEANRCFQSADHLTYVTYNLLKDKRLILSIIQNLYVASLSSIAAILHYEKLYKQISTLPLDIDSRIHMFENTIAKKYNIDSGAVRVVKELKLILDQHKNSPLAFSRKDNLVICSEDFTIINVVDINKLKNYVTSIRELVGMVNRICMNQK